MKIIIIGGKGTIGHTNNIPGGSFRNRLSPQAVFPIKLLNGRGRYRRVINFDSINPNRRDRVRTLEDRAEGGRFVFRGFRGLERI